MIPSASILVLVFVFTTWISGTFLSSSILCTYIGSWKQRLKLGDYDKLVVVMASVKVLLQGFITYGGILYYTGLFVLLPNGTFLPVIVSFKSLIDMCSWNTCWLSIFYCLKLVNISHPVFQWLRSSFSSSLTLLLLGSAVGTGAINLPFLWTTKTNVLQNTTGNSSLTTYSFKIDFLFALCNVVITTCSPFLLTLICIVLSIKSLLRHVRRMRKNEPSIKYSQIRGHVQASRTMILRLLLDLIFSFNVASVIIFSLNMGEVLGTLSWVVITIIPSAQSLILITGNPKLKKRMRNKCKCYHATNNVPSPSGEQV